MGQNKHKIVFCAKTNHVCPFVSIVSAELVFVNEANRFAVVTTVNVRTAVAIEITAIVVIFIRFVTRLYYIRCLYRGGKNQRKVCVIA